MPKVDLAYCMTLPPKKAVEYLKNKGYAVTWDWEELWQDAQAQAFTVAKATRLDILQDIRDAVEKALQEGKTLAWFEKELTPVLQAKGWWGRQEHVDGETGEVSQVQLGSPWRLQTIYRTNLQTAYMAGRYAEQLAWYARALAEITGKPVKERYLYALRVGKAIAVPEIDAK